MASLLRWLVRLVGIVVVGACFYYIAQHAAQFDLADRLAQVTARDMLVFAVALVLFTAGLVCVNLSWALLLRHFDPTHPPLVRLLAISLSWQLAKYLPANIFHYVGRTGEVCRYGIGLGAAVAANLAEIGLMVGIGVTAGLGSLGLSGTAVPLALPFLADPTLSLSPLQALGLAGLSLVLLGLALRWRWRHLHGQDGQAPIRRALLLAAGLVAVFFVAFAAASLIAGLPAAHGRDFPLLAITGVLIGAWVIGFVIPGAPGGLGVREAMIIAALEPMLGADAAIWLAFIQRGLALAGDLACFLLGGFLRLASPAPPTSGQ